MVQTPAVYGDIKPRTTTPTPSARRPNFNESMYFNFFDHAQRPRRLRPHRQPRQRGLRRGHAHPLPARRRGALQLPAAPRSRPTTPWTPAACASRSIEPLVKHRTTFEGGAVFLTEPVADGRPEATPSATTPRSASPSTSCTRPSAPSTAAPASAAPHADTREGRSPAPTTSSTCASPARSPSTARRCPDRRHRPARPLVGPALLAGDPLLSLAHLHVRAGPGHHGLRDHARRERARARRTASSSAAKASIASSRSISTREFSEGERRITSA